ncbi:MAG: ATP-binding protein [Lachnospiraceae bacterium]|nr:ATP-binding protein [Lachnospiraceae bacterium]
MTISDLRIGLQSLVIFRNLLENPVISALETYLNTADTGEGIGNYCRFVSELYARTENFSRYLLERVLEDENLYVKKYCSGESVGEHLEQCLSHELTFLEQLGGMGASDLTVALNVQGFLPSYETEALEFSKTYRERLQNIHLHGYGMFAKYHMFTVSDGQPVPVKYPDPQTLEELPGYEREREKIIANTEALLAGQHACNVLLYGDAGTGKSSTVKAIANAYYGKGLRLIEVKKNQLYQIPELVDSLGKNPLKFILFVDDLSFSANDDDFSALKAILEGSVGGRSSNVAVYATSNRRHLVKESLSDREGDDIHFFDTMQEIMSLSARFGLTVTFQRPEKEKYLQIVRALAKQHEVEIDDHTLEVRAEAHAIRNGGRTPRVAKQFVELLAAGVLEG